MTDRPIQVGDEVRATVRGKVTGRDEDYETVRLVTGMTNLTVSLADVERVKTRRDVLREMAAAHFGWNVDSPAADDLAAKIMATLDTFDADA